MRHLDLSTSRLKHNIKVAFSIEGLLEFELKFRSVYRNKSNKLPLFFMLIYSLFDDIFNYICMVTVHVILKI